MKIKNYYLYGTESYLNRLQSEYEFLGRWCKREPGTLIVLARKPQPVKKKEAPRPKKREY